MNGRNKKSEEKKGKSIKIENDVIRNKERKIE